MNSSVETILLYTIAAGFLSIVYGFFTGKNILNSSAGKFKDARYCIGYSNRSKSLLSKTI